MHRILSGLLTVHTQRYESRITITPFGSKVQPFSSSDPLVTTSGVVHMMRCARYCHQERLCRPIDYDIATGVCRILSNGVIVPSILMTSPAGTVYDAPSLNGSHGQPCTSNPCQVNRYLIHETGNTSQCPPGLVWNAPECVGA